VELQAVKLNRQCPPGNAYIQRNFGGFCRTWETRARGRDQQGIVLRVGIRVAGNHIEDDPLKQPRYRGHIRDPPRPVDFVAQLRGTCQRLSDSDFWTSGLGFSVRFVELIQTAVRI